MTSINKFFSYLENLIEFLSFIWLRFHVKISKNFKESFFEKETPPSVIIYFCWSIILSHWGKTFMNSIDGWSCNWVGETIVSRWVCENKFYWFIENLYLSKNGSQSKRSQKLSFSAGYDSKGNSGVKSGKIIPISFLWYLSRGVLCVTMWSCHRVALKTGPLLLKKISRIVNILPFARTSWKKAPHLVKF